MIWSRPPGSTLVSISNPSRSEKARTRHYKLNERWNLGFAVDHSPEFDFERTPDLPRFATPEVVDAKGTSTTPSGWVERVYRRPEGRYEWFWSAGLAFNSVHMKDISGDRRDQRLHGQYHQPGPVEEVLSSATAGGSVTIAARQSTAARPVMIEPTKTPTIVNRRTVSAMGSTATIASTARPGGIAASTASKPATITRWMENISQSPAKTGCQSAGTSDWARVAETPENPVACSPAVAYQDRRGDAEQGAIELDRAHAPR